MQSVQQSIPADSVAHRLATLFEQHLSITDIQDGPSQEQVATTQGQPQQQQQPVDVKYSISQHYTHSGHVNGKKSLHPLQPSRDDHITRLLIQNDIPPSSLLRSQLDLFERSTTDERARLMMLWRLAPPTYARNGGQELADRTGEYQSITLQQEEELAWLRYQRHYAQRDERADSRAEQLCGRQSVLGAYFGEQEEAPSAASSRQEPEVDHEMT